MRSILQKALFVCSGRKTTIYTFVYVFRNGLEVISDITPDQKIGHELSNIQKVLLDYSQSSGLVDLTKEIVSLYPDKENYIFSRFMAFTGEGKYYEDSLLFEVHDMYGKAFI